MIVDLIRVLALTRNSPGTTTHHENMESISEILSSTYTDSELKHVISVLDQENESEQRLYTQRTIRSQVETKLFERARNVCNQMRPVAKSVQSVGARIKDASESYNEIFGLLTSIQLSTATFSENARYLQSEAKILERQENTADAYINAFHVCDADRAIIESVQPELTPEFFEALERLKLIHSEAAQVLLAEAPSSGEHLMLEVGKLLDQAYLRIKSVIDAELRLKSRSQDNEAPPPNLRKYMSYLAERPLLFQAVLQEQSGLRQDSLVRQFSTFVALEKANAHLMPARFLGSVLAWVHAAIVNEFEHIGLLLDPETPPEEGSSTHEKSLEELLSTSDTRKIIIELVDSVIAKLETPLRQHINSVTLAQTEASTVDELHNVLVFYRTMLAKYEQPTLSSLLSQLEANLCRQFSHLMHERLTTWESRIDLALAVLNLHDNGIHRDSKSTQARLDEVLDDMLKQKLENAPPITALNIIDQAVSRLAGFVVAQNKLDKLGILQAEYETKQIQQEVKELKTASKLTELQVETISEREFLTQFDEFLCVANVDLQTRLEKLNSPTLQNRISSTAIIEFINEYEFAVKELKNARTAEEVRELLL